MTDLTPHQFDNPQATLRAMPGMGLPLHQATALTEGGQQALIALGDQVYHLRITRAGKLILTK